MAWRGAAWRKRRAARPRVHWEGADRLGKDVASYQIPTNNLKSSLESYPDNNVQRALSLLFESLLSLGTRAFTTTTAPRAHVHHSQEARVYTKLQVGYPGICPPAPPTSSTVLPSGPTSPSPRRAAVAAPPSSPSAKPPSRPARPRRLPSKTSPPGPSP